MLKHASTYAFGDDANFNVIFVGSGAVGLTAAVDMVRRGLTVALLRLLNRRIGIFGIFLLITVTMNIFIKTLKYQSISQVLVACLALLLFSPRAINLNIFP